MNSSRGLDLHAKAEKLDEMTIQKRVRYLLDSGVKIIYSEVLSKVFLTNLKMVDSQMDRILACIVKHYYSSDKSTVEDLTALVIAEDPCSFGPTVRERIYRHKIKEFLSACALGMTAAHDWSGEISATGGYIIVKEDGNLVCYHVYNFNEFKEYIFNNTFLDTPSTSRHDHGNAFNKQGEWWIKLNLQIRFS